MSEELRIAVSEKLTSYNGRKIRFDLEVESDQPPYRLHGVGVGVLRIVDVHGGRGCVFIEDPEIPEIRAGAVRQMVRYVPLDQMQADAIEESADGMLELQSTEPPIPPSR